MTAVVADPTAVRSGSFGRNWKRLLIVLLYAWRHRRWPSLDDPRLFTEWVQWRKLNDRSPVLAALTDKLTAKQVASERGYRELCVPTLWSGDTLPIDPPGEFPLVVKANHGCNQYQIVRSADDWSAARIAAGRWTRAAYGTWLGEGHYRAARRAVLVEPFIGHADGRVPEDYKVYVFGGRAAIVQHHVGRGGDHRWTQYDRDWKRVGGAPDDCPPPPNLDAMIAAAERLCAGHDFLRADFYDVDGRLWFGEFCLFPGSGLDPFVPLSLDRDLGELWTSAAYQKPGSGLA